MTDTNFIQKLEEINEIFLPISHNKNDSIQDHYNFLFDQFLCKSFEDSIGGIIPIFFELNNWNEWNYSDFTSNNCLIDFDEAIFNKIIICQSKLGNKLEKHFTKTVVSSTNQGRKNIFIELDNKSQEIFAGRIGKSIYKFTFPGMVHENIVDFLQVKYNYTRDLRTVHLEDLGNVNEREINIVAEMVLPLIKSAETKFSGFEKEIIRPVVTHSLYINNKYSLLFVFSHTVADIKNASGCNSGGLGGVFILIKKDLLADEENLKKIVRLFENISDKLSIRVINYFQLREVNKNQLKTAIISILVDSYAHNISAHSLAALKWWMELRNKIMDKRFEIKAGTEFNCLQPSSIVINKNKSDHECKKDSEIIINNTKETTSKYYEALGLKDSIYNENYYSLFDFLQFVDDKHINELFRFANVSLASFHPRFPVPIDYALFPFFRFLRDKGAFWSGVTRDMAYGGESKTWYKILWDDFANNPLYLGTIAKSEGINKINIYLKVKTKDGYCEGRFITVDMSVIDYETAIAESPDLEVKDGSLFDFENNKIKENKIHVAELNARISQENEGIIGADKKKIVPYVDPNKYSKYAFIKLGEKFAELKQILEDEKNFSVFLPGGLVGEHALFTIFENTIRNIKHYKDNLGEIKKYGIDFWISIEDKNLVKEKSYNPRKENINQTDESIKKELFKVGTWLAHPTQLVVNTNEYLLFDNTDRIEDSILDSISGTPKMGGNSQDKACAAMLFNNKFSSVESKDETERNKIYFPWIRFATGFVDVDNKGVIQNIQEDLFVKSVDEEDLNISKEEYERKIKVIHDKGIIPYGILKKYFYLWQSDNSLVVTHESDFECENVSRFKFVIISDSSEKENLTKKARKCGVIRILDDKPGLDNKNLFSLYNYWFDEWFPNTKYQLDFKEGTVNRNWKGKLKYEEKENKYIYQGGNYADPGACTLYLSHGEEKDFCLNVRSHGVFLTKFFKIKDTVSFKDMKYVPGKYCLPVKYKNDSIDMTELVETVMTRIAAFDNRLNSRIPQHKRGMFEDSLNLQLFDEDKSDWNTFKKNNNKTNILILHLSFIESLINEKNGQKYSEVTITDFIDNELINLIQNRSDFIFIITSGRGRDSWRNKLSDKQKLFTIFKPIEGLLTAIENAVSYNDNFDVKYNLIKTIFGS